MKNAFYACLGDFFIMREPVAGGSIAGTPGTDWGAPAPGTGGGGLFGLKQLPFTHGGRVGNRA